MNQPAGGVPDSTGFAHCYRHPNRETGVRCTRCDRPICADCMRPASVGFHCPDDVREGVKSIRAPRTSVGARILASPPYVTISLVVLNVAAYLITGTQKPGTINDPFGSSIFQNLVLQPYATQSRDEFYRLISSEFLHLSLLHILANMVALVIIGPPLERLLGRWRFLAVYLLSGLGGSTVIYVFGNQYTPTAGASGAIFGLFAACLILVRKLGLDLQSLAITVVLNFAITFSVPNISREGHIGGFVVGLLAGLVIGGLPNSRDRIGTRLQAIGLAALLVVLVVVIGIRTATF